MTYHDTATAERFVSDGDWTGSRLDSRQRALRERIICEIVITPSILTYRESCSAGVTTVEIERDDRSTLRLELASGGTEVRLFNARGDLGLRLPHPLGLMALAWWTEQPPYTS